MRYDFGKQNKNTTQSSNNLINNNNQFKNNRKTNNDVKINNYIDDYKDKNSQKNNNNTKPPKTNGQLKSEYDDNKNENESENNNKKKKQDNALIDYSNMLPGLQKINTYKNDPYTSAQLEDVRYRRELSESLEHDVATLTENERQQSDAEIGDRKEEAKKQKDIKDQEIRKEYSDKTSKIKKKFKDVNDKTGLFVKDYMEQFIISASIEDENVNGEQVPFIKPMVHNMGTMFDLLNEQKEQYDKQGKKDDTYAGVNGDIINILNKLDDEMYLGKDFLAVRKQAREFDRYLSEDTKDTSIYGVDKLGFFNYILDKLKRFVSIILSPIWNFSYDNSYKLLYKYNKQLLEILGSINGKNFSKLSIPKCRDLYKRILKLENESLILPVSKEKYLEPVKKFLSNFVMEKGDVNEDGCRLMIETCGFGNFIKSISKKVSGNDEKIDKLTTKYLFGNEDSIFSNITCTGELLKLLKKFDGKDYKELVKYFHSKFSGRKIKISNKSITIPPAGTSEDDEEYKKYKKQIEGILESVYDGTILTTSKNELMKKMKTKTAEVEIETTIEAFNKLKNFIHTMNVINNDYVDRINKLDHVYISSVLAKTQKIIGNAMYKNIQDSQSFGVLTLIKTKIETLKQEYMDKKAKMEEKEKKQIQKNKKEFLGIYKKMKEAIENPGTFKDTFVKEQYKAQFKKMEEYIKKKYGDSAIEETEDKERLKEIEREINDHINRQYTQSLEPPEEHSIYDEAINDIDKMLAVIQEQRNIPNDDPLKNIDEMFNERAKYSFETLKNMREMMRPGFGGGNPN